MQEEDLAIEENQRDPSNEDFRFQISLPVAISGNARRTSV